MYGGLFCSCSNFLSRILPVFQRNSSPIFPLFSQVIAYIREIDIEKERFFIALNFGSSDSEVDYFHTGGLSLPLQGSVVVSSDRGRESSRVELNKLHLKPGEGVVVLLDEIVHVGSGWWYKFFVPDA